jgi:hypothetical protein
VRWCVAPLALGGVLAAVLALTGGPTGTGSVGAVTAATFSHQARTAPASTRYSLVHGCYALRSTGGPVSAGDGPYRMQAAALGEYLLYGVHGDYLDSGLGATATPGADTVWRVDGEASRGFTLTNLGTGRSLPVGFVPAQGCAVYPEGAVDATGAAFTGASAEAQVSGTIDAHTHVTAFEFLGGDFHCGRPWSPYGIPFALPNCAPQERGVNGIAESFLDYGTLAHPHDTQGWPTFRAWPSATDLAEEGDYYTGIERAWKAGLRVMVTQLVDNEALCDLMTDRRNPCNDMDAVRLQARDLRALQDYIDAQSGGPGRGFFRIVTNPFQARRVINQGKLAVVEGIEVSRIFGCGEYLGRPQCDRAQIDAGLSEIRRLGVSTFFPIHKFDNAFGGVKMDGGDLGALINAGNRFETGSFWNIETCPGPEHDNPQLTVPLAGTIAGLLNGPAAKLLGGAVLPLYPAPPHCNTLGLTSLGTYLIGQMIRRHFIVELDHMDNRAADATLSILEAHRYSGVVSAHSWDSPQENPRIYRLGGFVTPIAGASPASFVSQWRDSLKIRDQRFYNGSGFGYGADMNGLAEQSQPSSQNPIGYPFHSYDGRVTFTREVWGQRTFDLNRDGVANYGMYPDWLQELERLAGRPILTDMFHGAEAYLEMWERAAGVPITHPRSARGRFTASGVGALRLGAGAEQTLYALGQPLLRPNRTYLYDVRGGGTVGAVFDRRGRVAVALATARGYSAGGVRPGGLIGAIRARARALGDGAWVGRARLAGGAHYLYMVSGGRVAGVGVVRRGAISGGVSLRSALTRRRS